MPAGCAVAVYRDGLGLLAHLEERLPCKQEVRGSSPRWSTFSGSRKTVICLIRIQEKPGSTPGVPTMAL
jgi:hypothetical protein